MQSVLLVVKASWNDRKSMTNISERTSCSLVALCEKVAHLNPNEGSLRLARGEQSRSLLEINIHSYGTSSTILDKGARHRATVSGATYHWVLTLKRFAQRARSQA